MLQVKVKSAYQPSGSSGRSLKQLGVFLLPPGCDASPWVHTPGWSLTQEHNPMSPARAQTRSARSRDERTNHECIVFLVMSVNMYFLYLNIDAQKPFSVKLNKGYVILWSAEIIKVVFFSFCSESESPFRTTTENLFPAALKVILGIVKWFKLWNCCDLLKNATKTMRWFVCTFKHTTEHVRSLIAREIIHLEGCGASAP